MPSAYAHYRFGQDVCRLLTAEEQRTVLAFPELFAIGLHGPDIFFYHHPLGGSPVNRLGHELHGQPALQFFLPALTALPTLGDREAGLAYLYGFLCHFALDTSCHPYVEAARKEKCLTHMEIESDFDRRLMLRDGLDPLTHFPVGHIIPSSKNAGIISAFFPSITAKEVEASLRSMLLCNRLIISPRPPKRCLIHVVLALSGNARSMRGLLIRHRANPQCRDSNRQLMKLYRQALPLAAELIHNYRAVFHGLREPDPRLKRTFG